MNGASDLSLENRYALARAVLTAACGYFVLAAATIRLTSDGRSHATVWPADALVLALLLNAPRRLWPPILVAGWLGNLVANGVTRGWTAGIVLYGAINMAQTLLAATLLIRSSSGKNLLESPRASIRFLWFAGCLAPALGAAAGSIVSLFNYGQAFGPSFLRWFAGNGLGLVIGTPFFLAVLDGSYRRCLQSRVGRERLEAFLLLGLHCAVTALVFGQTKLPLLFLPLSSLMVLSFWLGRLGTLAGVIVVAIGGAIAACGGWGPMAMMHSGPFFEAIYFQVYIAVILCTALPVAATVSSRAAALDELAGHRQVLQQVLTHSPDGILSFDEAGVCRWADGRLEEFTGLEPSKMVGLTLQEIALQTSPDLARLVEAASRPESDGQPPRTRELSARLRPGRTLEASLGIIRQGGRRSGTVITLRDISVRKSREVAISKMAETDDLTGVLNRKGFRARVNDALEAGTAPLALALIDVDHFKSINDSFGHAVGDRVLAEVAARLNRGTRSSDMVGRLGGDEFAILFASDTGAAQSICERITASLRELPILDEDGLRLTITISCGIARHEPGMTRGEFYDAADSALYTVKRSGRDGVLTSIAAGPPLRMASRT